MNELPPVAVNGCTVPIVYIYIYNIIDRGASFVCLLLAPSLGLCTIVVSLHAYDQRPYVPLWYHCMHMIRDRMYHCGIIACI